MRPPAWMKMEYVGVSEDRRSVNYKLTVNRWHPGFWWFVIRELVRR